MSDSKPALEQQTQRLAQALLRAATTDAEAFRKAAEQSEAEREARDRALISQFHASR